MRDPADRNKKNYTTSSDIWHHLTFMYKVTINCLVVITDTYTIC